VRRIAALAAAAALAVPASAEAQDVSINWVGDMAFSRSAGLPPDGAKRYFRDVGRYLRRGDLTTGNLEGTLGRAPLTKCRGDCHEFQAPASYAGVFRRAGFGLLNLANNHSHDAGERGLRDTRSALRRAGVGHTGLNGQITVKREWGDFTCAGDPKQGRVVSRRG